MHLDQRSRDRLGPRLIDHFAGDTLFDRVARAVCQADCLPRKELYESWEVARRTRRRFRGGRVVDLCCGHGLIAHLMLIMDDTSPAAIAVDRAIPASAARVAASLVACWPRLSGRVDLVTGDLSAVSLGPSDLVVSAHACGALTDQIVDMSLAARARLAIVPCCHDLGASDDGGLAGWMDGPLAVDVTRAQRLRAAGYRIHTARIPESITPQNRLLLAWPE
jgi:SAM-dependent methyltransferase